MNKQMFAQFAGYEMSAAEMKSTKGGLCACMQAVPYDCEILGGHPPGSAEFSSCMYEGYSGCMIHDPSCQMQ